eukprot:TRINITY_DN14408_c0_g1_i1.p1 TRINITY_DN14408_c0_g1~~TRINITY_DN14408_c0_g1_i1.p1  ORF type:complete len:853 (-),score=215.11 TRINITY_DN14408_c0_g1_i1:281-2758(-)
MAAVSSDEVAVGTVLQAKEEAIVFAAVDSIEEVGTVAVDSKVVVAGRPLDMGVWMVPIEEPSGAVQLDSFAVVSSGSTAEPSAAPAAAAAAAPVAVSVAAPAVPVSAAATLPAEQSAGASADAVGAQAAAAATAAVAAEAAGRISPVFSPSAIPVDFVRAEEPGGQRATGDGEGAEPTFAEDMWDRFEFVCTHRVKPSTKVMDDFVNFLKERAQVEKAYAEGLQRSIARLQKRADQGYMPPAMDVLMTSTRNRAEQSYQLGVDLETDVAATVEEVLHQHIDVTRRVFLDGQRLTRYLVDATRSHDALATKYAKACEEAERVAGDCLAGEALFPGERLKLAEKSLVVTRDAAVIERDYYRAVQRMNAATELHRKHMGGVMGALQEVEEKRARCLHDTAMKLSVYDTSWLRNTQYDLEAVVQTVEAGTPADDLHAFIRKYRTPAQRPGKVAPRAFWVVGSPAGDGDGSAGALALHPASPSQGSVPGATPPADHSMEPLLRELLHRKAGDASVAESDAFRQLKKRLSGGAESRDADEPGQPPPPIEASRRQARACFCRSLRAEVSKMQQEAGNSQEPTTSSADAGLGAGLEEEEEAPPLNVSLEAFQAIAPLVCLALDGCDADNDAWCGRDLLLLSRSIQCVMDERNIDILFRVYSHKMWSRVTFWEEVLMIGLTEAHARPALARRRSTEFPPEACSGAPEISVSPFLRRFLVYMVALGIKQEQAKGWLQRALRAPRYKELLGAGLVEAFLNAMLSVPLKPSQPHLGTAALPAAAASSPGPSSPVAPDGEAATLASAPADAANLLDLEPRGSTPTDAPTKEPSSDSVL